MVIVEQMFLHPYMEYLDRKVLNNSAIITICINNLQNVTHIEQYLFLPSDTNFAVHSVIVQNSGEQGRAH